jgi:transcriptional regulator GlxA family with amidase domain
MSPYILAIQPRILWNIVSFLPKFCGVGSSYSQYAGAWAIRSGVTVDRRVQAVIDYMLEDLSRPLRLEEIAHTVNLSVSRLQHLFKADTNKTAAQYLKSLRMQMAKQMIDSTFLNTKEIMQRVGMKDESHFVREFKKIYGLPPGSYKRHLPTPRITTAKSANK